MIIEGVVKNLIEYLIGVLFSKNIYFKDKLYMISNIN